LPNYSDADYDSVTFASPTPLERRIYPFLGNNQIYSSSRAAISKLHQRSTGFMVMSNSMLFRLQLEKNEINKIGQHY